MAALRKVNPEIMLVAFVQHPDNTRSIIDIIETDNHYASGFVRRWLKDPEIVAIGTRVPGAKELHIRDIRPAVAAMEC